MTNRPSILFPLLVALAACGTPVDKNPDSTAGDTDALVVDTDTAPAPTATPTPAPQDTAVADDLDRDGILDDDDNCPEIANADQTDGDRDDIGDVCDDDVDGDGIPNLSDLFPRNPNKPGRASPDTVYAHGPDNLYAFSVVDNSITLIGEFLLPNGATSGVTDIAVDRYGVLYAVTHTTGYVCHPDTVQCWEIGGLGGRYNGLTFLPPQMGGTTERLVGIADDGTWTQYTGAPFSMTSGYAGTYGGSVRSSGDVFYIEGTGTFAAVTGGGGGVRIVEVGLDGTILRTVAAPTSSGIYGLAGWDSTIYAFAADRSVWEIDPITGAAAVVATGPENWWGAGVRTVITLPQAP